MARHGHILLFCDSLFRPNVDVRDRCQRELGGALFNSIDIELCKIEAACAALGYSQGSLAIKKAEAHEALANNCTQTFLMELVHPSLEGTILSHQSDVQKLAKNLGRAIPVLIIDPPHGRHPMNQGLKSALNQCLTHIFRNALDHSIEKCASQPITHSL